MRCSWLLISAVVLACGGKDAVAPPPAEAPYTSREWSYRYTQDAYSEGLRSVDGTLSLSRSEQGLRISPSGDVVGHFWSHDGTDTTQFSALLWPAGFVYQATTTPGDTFIVASSNAPQAFPSLGVYTLTGDTVRFLWEAANDVAALSLGILYLR